MLLVLAAVILIISFVIAFISLLAEERKREKLSREATVLPDDEAKSQDADLQEPASVAGMVQENSVSPPAPKEEVSQATTSEEVFPWKQNLQQEGDISSGGASQSQADAGLAEDARFPNLSGSQGTAGDHNADQDLGSGEFHAGVIKISDIVKKREE